MALFYDFHFYKKYSWNYYLRFCIYKNHIILISALRMLYYMKERMTILFLVIINTDLKKPGNVHNQSICTLPPFHKDS